MRSLLFLPAVLCGIAAAQPNPAITGGPYNAASYAVTGQPNSGIAQGAMFVVVGTNLGPQAIQIVSAFPLPNSLAGTSIRIAMAGNNYDAIMVYTVAGAVAAILPSAVPIGNGTLTLTYNGRTSTAVPIRVVKTAFGIFTRNQAGTGPGIIQNFNSATDLPTNSLVDAAHHSQVEVLWGTGLGAVSGNEAGGVLPGDLPVNVEVFVQGQPAVVSYKGRSGCCAGIDQIAFTVPPGVEGCFVSVAVRVDGVVSNFVTMSITPTGKVCSDPNGLSSADLQKVANGSPLSIGQVTLIRGALRFGILQANAELADAAFLRFRNAADVLSFSTGAVAGGEGFPSLGSCYVSPFRFDGDILNAVFPEVIETSSLETLSAGAALNFTSSTGSIQVPLRNDSDGPVPLYRYNQIIGGGIPGSTSLPPFVAPGNITVTNGAGSSSIGPFTTSLNFPANPVTWSNQDAINNISRAQNLTVNWSGGAAGSPVIILGASVDTNTNAAGFFVCTARAEAGIMTIPSWVLSALPASGQVSGISAGLLQVGSVPGQPVRFQATGLDVGFFTWLNTQLKAVAFQ
jgi:uncharacterized protein (TIGR03437 family)